jgi:hypothetical protein
MQISDVIRDQIASNMELKTTEELQTILKQNDREEWTDVAFEVVKEILLKRTGEIPQNPVQQEDPLEGEWKSMDWKQVYAASQKEMKSRSNYGLVLLSFSMLTMFFMAYKIQAPEARNVVLAIGLLIGFLGLGLWYFARKRTPNRLVLKARVYLKTERGYQRNDQYWVEIVILKALTLTSEGEVFDAEKWKGHKKVVMPGTIYHRIRERDTLELLCLSNGSVLGKLREYARN